MREINISDILVLRGAEIESRHRVRWLILDDQTVRQSAGDIDLPVFPRSAIKPLQALPLVESGAADAFGLDQRQLALACASHSGEAKHVEVVQDWLARLDLGPTDLECGAHLPSGRAAAEALMRRGERPSTLHNNCSGKHAGMLTLARHLNVDLRGYIEPDHPVQTRIAATLADLAKLERLPQPAIDGCGMPTFPLSLREMALAMASFVCVMEGDDQRGAACRRLADAMQTWPDLVAGEERPCTLIMRALPGVLAKTGAEGVYLAALPKRRLVVALKVEDGASRASPVALLALLKMAGALPASAEFALRGLVRPVLRNHRGREVGCIRPGEGWTGTVKA